MQKTFEGLRFGMTIYFGTYYQHGNKQNASHSKFLSTGIAKEDELRRAIVYSR